MFLVSLSSFDSSKRVNKLIGTWKVESVARPDGRIKEGRKTITFSKDGKVISEKDTGSKMTGLWEFDGDVLLIYKESKDKGEKFTVLKLTRKKLILKDDRKTYTAVKVK